MCNFWDKVIYNDEIKFRKNDMKVINYDSDENYGFYEIIFYVVIWFFLMVIGDLKWSL